MITVEEVRGAITRQLRGRVPDGVRIEEDTVLEEIGLSSLQISEIVFSLEEAHGFEFDAAKAADMRTLGELVSLANDALGAPTS